MFRPSPVNHVAFDELTPVAAYWLGFLMADGMVHSKKAKRKRSSKTYSYIILALSRTDRAHVEKFKQFIGTTNVIQDVDSVTNFGPKKSSVLTVQNDHLARRLDDLGVRPNKTGTEKCPAELENSRDFWRGMIDGDGSVGMWKNKGRLYPGLKLGSTPAVIEQFSKFVRRLGITPTEPGNCRGLCAAAYSGNPAQKIIRVLYQDGDEALDRKMTEAKACLAWNPEHVPMSERQLVFNPEILGSNRTVNVICGASGSGKSWICRQLADEGLICYVEYDRSRQFTDRSRRLISATFQDKPIVFDPNKNVVSLSRSRGAMSFNIIVVCEQFDVVKQRLSSRSGRPTNDENLRRRIRRFETIARLHGSFCGTAEEVLAYCRRLFMR
jgi:hypothetical protein